MIQLVEDKKGNSEYLKFAVDEMVEDAANVCLERGESDISEWWSKDPNILFALFGCRIVPFIWVGGRYDAGLSSLRAAAGEVW